MQIRLGTNTIIRDKHKYKLERGSCTRISERDTWARTRNFGFWESNSPGEGSISFLFYALLEHDSGNDVDNDHDDDRPLEGMARPRWPRKGRISCSRDRLGTGRCWNCGTIFAIFSVGVNHSVKDCLNKIWRIWPTFCVYHSISNKFWNIEPTTTLTAVGYQKLLLAVEIT